MGIAGATSIREKISRIVLASVLASLLFAGAVLGAFDLLRQVRDLRSDLRTQADVLALASQAALSFSDQRAAVEYLDALSAQESISAAALYDARGRLFAAYLQNPAPSLPSTVPSDGVHLSGRYAVYVRSVQAGGQNLGRIYLRAEHHLLARAIETLVALGLVLAISLFAGHVFATRLQRHVTEPVIEISGVARQILRGQTHAVRAEKRSNDEVGDLVEAFNAMLAELGARADRLEESNRAKDRFLATLAHELRNPLAPIRTGLEILKRNPDNPAAALRARQTMERQLAQMIHLIDDLLDISRVNTGKFKLDRRPTSVRWIVDAALEAVRPAVDARGQHLSVDLPPDDVVLDVDPVRMTQALGNLLGNASKYTPDGGEIALALRCDPEGVRIEVRDSGIGIAPEDIQRVFELFAQLPSAQDRAYGGLGIGLFLVRSVAELHGGRVEAASAGTGRGAVFTVHLPAGLIVDEQETVSSTRGSA